MKNKNGISAVVATVLIVLITVAAVAIIWAGILPIVDQLEGAGICSNALTALSIVSEGYTCFNSSVPPAVNVQVKYGANDIGLVGIQVLISDDAGDSYSTDVTENLPKINERKTLVVPYFGTAAESVSIAPIVSVGEQDKTCDAVNTVQLYACI